MKKRVKSLIIKLADQMKRDFTHVYYNNTQRYYPHELFTRLHPVLLYRAGKHSVKDVIRWYKISKASLFDWSQHPHSSHPNAHTSEELSNIQNLIKRKPNVTLCKLFEKLRTKYHYKKHITSLYTGCWQTSQ